MDLPIKIIGYASGVGAGDKGCEDGAQRIFAILKEDSKRSRYLECDQMLEPQPEGNPCDRIQALCQKLAQHTQAYVKQKQTFIVLGGDHSSAIGTWSGVKSALPSTAKLGLIWVDAHLDSHTFATTHSGNIHGMPLAALLGQGDTKLTTIFSALPKVNPENVFVIGARSFEEEEQKLLKRLNVRIYSMNEIKTRSLKTIFQEVLLHMQAHVTAFGVSLDLDGLDPSEIAGVGTPEENGIPSDEFLANVTMFFKSPQWLGIEIAEYNPHHDQDGRTQQFILKLMSCVAQPRVKNGAVV